jgi:hypothetical protein
MALALSPRTRVIRAALDSPAGILLEEESVSMVGSSDNFVKVGSRGTGIRGSECHINMGPMRRLGGFWVDQIEFLQMIPKTIITPIPTIMPMPPMMAMVNLAQDIAFFAAMLV